jgi:hypothetical protein
VTTPASRGAGEGGTVAERAHPDIFRETDAATYLRFETVKEFREASSAIGLLFHRVGRMRIYHRAELDRAALRMFARFEKPSSSVIIRYRDDEQDDVLMPRCLVPLLPVLKRYKFTRNIPPCVYFLIFEGALVYVGQTRDLNCRVGRHCQKLMSKPFDAVYYLLVDDKELDPIESTLIRRFKPRLNGSVARVHAGRRLLTKYGIEPQRARRVR